MQKLGTSQRRVCQVLGINRSVLRYNHSKGIAEEALRTDLIRLASQYGRYGYRRIQDLLGKMDTMKALMLSSGMSC